MSLISLYPKSPCNFPSNNSHIPSSIPYAEIESKTSIGKYNLEFVGGINTPWVIFNTEITTEDKNKFHISIKRDRLNLEKAYKVIFPILEKYQVSYFKIIPLASIEIGGNCLGKEYTIYVKDSHGEESQATFWSHHVLKEIVENLEKEGVEQGKISTGDIPIKGGKNFIYSRSSYNIFDFYITSTFLERCGFTAEESARFTPSFCVDLIIDGYSEIETISDKPTLPVPEILSDVKSENKRIYDCFVDVLTTKIDRMGIIKAPPLFFILVGTQFGDCRLESKYHKIFNFLFEDREWDKWTIRSILNVEGIDLIISKLNSYLEKAAILTASIHSSLNESPLKSIGNIHPAIYHSFIVPLAKKFDGDLLNSEEEMTLILHLAICALRTQHPDLNDPQMIRSFAEAVFK